MLKNKKDQKDRNALLPQIKTNDDTPYFHAFNLTHKITARHFHKLLNYFSALKDAWVGTKEEFLKIGFTEKAAEQIIFKRDEINPEKEFEKLAALNINVITIKNNDYPLLLKEIFDPPALFYFRGNKKLLKETIIGIVGSRRMTIYGKETIPEIVGGLTENNIVIASGLAWGIDAEAHRSTLKFGGKTIAVLGSGIDDQSIYPSLNKTLAKNIIEKEGLLISEYPPATLPFPHYFPERNRIISGISRGVLVVEAAEKSGALITARLALEQNREVFAIPGNIHQPYSFGPNRLIQMGAKLVLNAEDILEELNIAEIVKRKQKLPIPKNEKEAIILDILKSEQFSIDEIVKKTKLPAGEVSAILSLMEIDGKVKNIGGMNYIRT